nr:MAG TPA: hypothetical protein [Caudoviricetes sp.]
MDDLRVVLRLIIGKLKCSNRYDISRNTYVTPKKHR